MSLCLNNPNFNNIKNEKQNNLTIGEKNINTPFKKIIYTTKQYLNNKYGTKSNNLNYNYLGLIMKTLIFNKNTHLVSVFKDYMIIDYVEEFLKRYYNNWESTERIPKFSNFYKNYLKFFCSPTLREYFYNDLIHNRLERKAEFFYKKNYNSKKNNNDSSLIDKGLCEESETSEESEENENSKNKIEKTFFNTAIRKRIEKYSPIRTSMALPESGSKLKKSNSGLLITNSNEKSLFNIVNELDLKNSFMIKKNPKKRIKNNNSIINNNKNIFINNSLNKNYNINNIIVNKDGIININKNNNNIKKDEKIEDNIILISNINIDSSSSNRILKRNSKMFEHKIKKFEKQSLKILLNNNNALLNSKSSKKYMKNEGLLKLLRDNDNVNNKNSKNNNNEYQSSILNNNQNSLYAHKNNRNKNKIFSYLDYYRKKQKSNKNKFSQDEIDKNKNIIKNNSQYNQNNINNNINNIQLCNNFSTNSIKNKSCKINLPKNNNINSVNNTNYTNKNNLESIINKAQINAFNSIKKMASKQKIILKNENKKSLKLTRNSNYNMNKIGLFGLTSYITNSNQNEIMPNLNKSNNNNKNNNNNNNININSRIRFKSNKTKRFYHSPSSIFDFIKMSKLKKAINNNYEGDIQQEHEHNNKYIQNVNININNQINIGINNIKDLVAFSGSNKKNKVGRKIISRNQNRNIEFKTINQNKGIHNSDIPVYKGNKKNQILYNINKMSTINQKNSFGRNEYINSNKDLNLVNHYFLHSFKTINNSNKKI